MFEKSTDELKAAREAMLEIGKRAIKGSLKEFMDAHPEVAKLRFQTYTPSFNDGDPCEFTIGEPMVLLASQGDAADADDGDDDSDEDDDEAFIESWDISKTPGMESLAADLESLNDLLQNAEDAVEQVFGDGSQVTIDRDGEAEISSYDCGY